MEGDGGGYSNWGEEQLASFCTSLPKVPGQASQKPNEARETQAHPLALTRQKRIGPSQGVRVRILHTKVHQVRQNSLSY